MNEDEGKIKDILKALGHRIRREIIRIIDENNNPLPYSHLLKTLDLPASSNIAYHIKILNDANLIEKNQEGNYYLTKEGKHSLLLFGEVNNSFSSKISVIGQKFNKLNPFYILGASWWFSFLFLGIILVQSFLIIGILLIIVGISAISIVIYNTRTIISYIFIQMFLWIFFLRKNKVLILIINITSIFGVSFLFGTVRVGNDIYVTGPIKDLIGLVMLSISIICTFIYLYLSYKKDKIDPSR